MSNTAIKVENLSKIYRLGEIGTGTISRDMERWFKTKVLKQEDPFLKIGESNDRASKGKSDIVYSLQDINFEIQQGDVVGIIGRNGAGKSTLLKILSRVTTPTTGKINIKGRVASLLEVGTGFHPELTGIENIYLNGAILGMRKREIDRKLDEIIDFSGVERYIDTPVKRYSSGMYVRLAFAVAAHLESEILIVDEVLAVGDAEFQKKCLGKMGEVSKGEGRTVLFVSHNMTSIETLCKTGLLLRHGSIDFTGDINSIMDSYFNNGLVLDSNYYSDVGNNSNTTKIKSIQCLDENSTLKSEFKFNEQILIKLILNVIKDDLKGFIGFKVKDNNNRVIFSSEIILDNVVDEAGENFINIYLPRAVLIPNKYRLNFAIHFPNVQIIEFLEDIVAFEILEAGADFQLYRNVDYGCVILNSKWLNSKQIFQ